MNMNRAGRGWESKRNIYENKSETESEESEKAQREGKGRTKLNRRTARFKSDV